MKIDPQRRYASPESFFDLDGSVVMKLSADSATAICRAAGARGLVITRVEGGIWHHPGFEARVVCIWDGVDPPVSRDVAMVNNKAARDFINDEKSEHDTFVITALRFEG
jgi:hypothetical protein